MEKWVYDEFKHCGVDYSDPKNAETYDKQHQKFRDYKKEFENLMKFLEIIDTKEKTLIDLACGTGAVSIFASEIFRKVIAVDVSEQMLEQAKRKVRRDTQNIYFINAGFLSYEHHEEPADLIVTKAALHHLPDFWKQIALFRMNKMVKMDGILYIGDVIFQFDPLNYKNKINQFFSGFEKTVGNEFKSEIEIHIRDEYSTFDWVFNGMLKKAGFTIEKNRSKDDFFSEYCCRKVCEIDIK